MVMVRSQPCLLVGETGMLIDEGGPDVPPTTKGRQRRISTFCEASFN
jgi:hypothetical protein